MRDGQRDGADGVTRDETAWTRGYALTAGGAILGLQGAFNPQLPAAFRAVGVAAPSDRSCRQVMCLAERPARKTAEEGFAQ